MEAARERDYPVKDPRGVPTGRRCTCGADMLKREVRPATTSGSHDVRWACSCCGRSEHVVYDDDGSAAWGDT